MRDTLYFKDDDSRLSFLQGNYITLTNMRDKDIERVIKYHLSPINISVHTTNPELRCKMLHNRFAGDVLDKIGRFYEAGIRMNSQVVLCQGLNDEEELDRTISDLGKFIPHMESLSVVPVGLTKYREGLAPLKLFGKEDAKKVLVDKTGAGNDFLGWIDLPVNYDKEEFDRIKKAAKKIQEDSEVLIVIGIGGSYLGARAAIDFLRHGFYNNVSKEIRKTPEIYYAGNSISPAYLQGLIDVVGDRDFSVNIISKSGTTTEPAIAFRICLLYTSDAADD